MMAYSSYGQITNKRTKWVKTHSPDLILDSLSILPNSLKILYPKDSSLSIQYDINTNKANVVGDTLLDSVLVTYAVLPLNLAKPVFKRDISKLKNDNYYRDNFLFPDRALPEKREELFSSPGINKTGTISRGISFGNNQNVFVNSVLNLQLEGKITNDVKITAVISDQNIPIQPDGNTQHLQQFDKVYIQLESDKGRLIAGDVVMANHSSYFLKYYRNVQGGQINYNFRLDSAHNTAVSAGIAISKGKFSSMLFSPGQQDSLLEGVQGPYRLRGPNNERFIVVLANSEKVYLDGKLLQRGFDYDYIIDYNQAEITFTPKVLITKFSRLRVDFEFADRVYSRTISNAGVSQNITDRLSVSVNYYQERDNPHNPLTLTLRDQDKRILSEIGDSLNNGVIESVDSIGFSPDLILYKKIIQNGKNIYIYSTNKDSAFFNILFTYRGENNGDYIQMTSTSNGKVFKYVGSKMGNYDPVKLLPTPKQKNMISIGSNYKISSSDNIFAEFAFSKNDINLYSKVNSNDDNGRAVRIGHSNTGRRVSFLKSYKWTSLIDLEFIEKSFSIIDRFRNPDFERDWSENTKINSHHYMLSAGIGLVKDYSNTINYQVSKRLKENDVNGIQHKLQLNKSFGNLKVLSNLFFMENKRPLEKSSWNRVSINTFYETKHIVPGVIYNQDKNKVISDTSQKVISTAMNFEEVKYYIRNNDSAQVKYFSDYSTRKDFAPINGELLEAYNSNTSNFGLGTTLMENHEVNSIFTYRKLENKNIGGRTLPNEETVLGRIDLNSNILNRHVRSELTVTTGTGRELRRQFIFIPAFNNAGNFIFVDFNKDGKKDLNEFVEKPYNVADTTYIKTFIPTDEYFKAYTSTINYRLDILAPTAWRHESGLKKFASKFSNVSSWTNEKKITDKNLWERFSPLTSNINEDNLLSMRNILRTVLFFNRANPQYGMELNILSSNSKQFLFQGFQTQNLDDYKWNGRLNINKFMNVRLNTGKSVKLSQSDFLLSRNFKILTYSVAPDVSYQPRNNLRITFLAAFSDKQNVLTDGPREKVFIKELGMEVRASKVSQRTINASGKLILISNKNFNILSEGGNSLNSPLAFEMMQGFQQGRNLTWGVVWQEKLTNGLQLSFNYEGRKSEFAKIVHIGRVQVSALF